MSKLIERPSERFRSLIDIGGYEPKTIWYIRLLTATAIASVSQPLTSPSVSCGNVKDSCRRSTGLGEAIDYHTRYECTRSFLNAKHRAKQLADWSDEFMVIGIVDHERPRCCTPDSWVRLALYSRW
jgi:hypothetical protein